MVMSKNKNRNVDDLIKFGMWNIESLTKEKLKDPNFHNILSDFSFISFVETWLGESSDDAEIKKIFN